FVALGGLVALACLASTGYINRLQADLARAVRYDAAGMEAAVELQVQLRHLRVHSLVLVADPSDARRDVVRSDLARVDAALAALLSGYATARGLSQRVARLSVRVRAVQAQLDQEVGAMTVERPGQLGDLDDQLDRVVGRVREVCRKLQEQERDLLRAEQLAAVGQLAAGVAHEIRNPLTGIKFLVEGALRPAGSTPLSDEGLRVIRADVVRMGGT